LKIDILLDRALRQNDDAAFNELHAATYPYVYRVAFSVTRNATLAEDAAQATFLVLLKRGRKIKHEAALMSWLWKTTRYISLRALRDEQKNKKSEIQMVTPTTEPNSAELEVFDAMKILNERDRNLLILRYCQQHTVEEVAAMNRISVSAAQMRISRALEKVRKRAGILSVAAVVGILGGPSVEAAVPSIKLASSTAIHLSTIPAWKLSLSSTTYLISTIPTRSAVAATLLAVGAGTGVWYLAHQSYELDVDRLNQFDKMFSGRYTGTVQSTYKQMSADFPDKIEEDNSTSKVTFVIRKFENPDRLVFRAQAGDRQVNTFSFYPVKGTSKVSTDQGLFNYELSANRLSLSGDYVMEAEMGKKDKNGKWTRTVFRDPATLSVTAELKQDGELSIDYTIKSRLASVEKYNLRRIR
jgi:RNA polymerase sigma factor (sigma-70 family)